MKKAIFTIMLAVASVALNAQTFTAKTSSGGGFNADSGTLTNETFIVDGQSYELWSTESGSRYVKLISPRTGKTYPIWVGTPTEHTFEGRTVYRSKKGSYCVYISSAKSEISFYAKWLDKSN